MRQSRKADIEMDKLAKTSVPVNELIQKRWSPRALTGDPISGETFARLFEAARWAPSSRNKQPWRFVLVTKDDGQDYQSVLECLGESNQEWAVSAYALVVVITEVPAPDRPVPISVYDAGLAVSLLTIEALNNDLYLHQMGGVDRDKLRDVCQIPDTHLPVVVTAIGQLGNIDNLPEGAREKDSKPRERLPLVEIVFRGKWAESAELR